MTLSQRLADVANNPEMSQDVSTAIRELARRLAVEAEQKAARDADFAEWRRPATEVELADLAGIKSFLGRLFPVQTGPAVLPELLAPVATRLTELHQHMAAAELLRASAVSRTPSSAQAQLFIDVARGLIP